MLPRRSIATVGPALALRPTLASRAMPARLTPSSPAAAAVRLFSSAPSSSIPRARGATAGLASRRAPLIRASGAFAQRAGSSRNLSLWPFWSSQQTSEASPTTTTTTTTTPAGSSSETASPTASASISTPTPPEPQPATIPATDPSAAVTDLADPDAAATIDPFSGLELPSVLDLPEQIGYLKSLGLDYGWGPTSLVQYCLEHLYIYTGMPWWAAIGAFAVLTRLILLRPSIEAARHQARMAKLTADPRFIECQNMMKQSKATGKSVDVAVAYGKMKKLKKDADVKMWKSMVPILLAPLSYGFFRLFRGMAAIPVPSLETGGLGWFTDLSVYDPTYILPTANMVMTALMTERMNRASVNVTPGAAAMQKGMIYVLPPIMWFVTAWFPAGVNWFFLILSACSTAQAQLIITPAFRRWVGLDPLPARPQSASSTERSVKSSWKSPVKRVREGMVDAREGLKGSMESMGVSQEKSAISKAQQYEEKRAREEKEATMRRMDQLRSRGSHQKR
ncbi:60Kd inner membrane protein-domain-containing protein [Xylariaceae sp. FL0804]|nr:60Kd inner membrane protein-domain-containing protein [Xylariaceae sp. FL0804]